MVNNNEVSFSSRSTPSSRSPLGLTARHAYPPKAFRQEHQFGFCEKDNEELNKKQNLKSQLQI